MEELMDVLELLKMENPNPTNPIANKIPAAKIKILLLFVGTNLLLITTFSLTRNAISDSVH